ncbi:GlxA family transcriptional regulator [Aliikangiella sp. G2MR2-5]|uniref:GlxA family transcriptional regulator n=1 Tax=Aliikangiella sp. G2MR2-5 TaxID=2788943 RepID=UPI0018AC132D|nr:helix-turn-helix domain-containing protein [Aliikangiella sp. G2MR2-5]
MKKVYVLAANEALATGVTGPMDMFNLANTLWHKQQRNQFDPLFDIQLAGLDKNPIKISGGLDVVPAIAIDEIEQADLLFIAAHNFTVKSALKAYCQSIASKAESIKRLHADGCRIAAYCSGTFALAGLGMLDDKKATTSWWFKDYFHSTYPKVEIDMSRLVVEQDGVWTAGATTSYLDLCLNLIEQLAGQEISNMLSKIMLQDTQKRSQLPFLAIPESIDHGDSVIAESQQWIQKHYHQNFNLDLLADNVAMSKRNYIRRFKKAVGETPNVYLQRIRVEAAKRYLETSELTLQKIVERVGYDDVSAFRKVFQKITSLTPKSYRLRFAR